LLFIFVVVLYRIKITKGAKVRATMIVSTTSRFLAVISALELFAGT
jgi:hypothetical protein